MLIHLFSGILFAEAIPQRTAIALDSFSNGSQETYCLE
jgi:hypothetical protein